MSKILEIEQTDDDELVIHVRRPNMKLMSGETAGHLMNARKELLLAIRGVIDAAIECGESQQKAKGQGRRKIEVQ